MRKVFPSLLLFAVSSVLMVHADDLVARDGTVYHNYKVLSHDAGFVTILDSDGGGKIPLSNLPDDLQKKYGYNKQQADAAVQAATEQDRQDRQAIAQEQAQRQQQAVAQAQVQAQAQAQTDPQASAPAPGSGPIAPVQAVSIQPTAPPTPATPAGPAGSTGNAPASPNLLSQDDIDAINQKISDLETEVALQLREQRHETGLDGDSSHGASAQVIESDKAKIADLKKQLADNARAVRRAAGQGY